MDDCAPKMEVKNVVPKWKPMVPDRVTPLKKPNRCWLDRFIHFQPLPSLRNSKRCCHLMPPEILHPAGYKVT